MRAERVTHIRTLRLLVWLCCECSRVANSAFVRFFSTNASTNLPKNSLTAGPCLFTINKKLIVFSSFSFLFFPFLFFSFLLFFSFFEG